MSCWFHLEVYISVYECLAENEQKLNNGTTRKMIIKISSENHKKVDRFPRYIKQLCAKVYGTDKI